MSFYAVLVSLHIIRLVLRNLEKPADIGGGGHVEWL